LNPNTLKLRDFIGMLQQGHDFVEQSRLLRVEFVAPSRCRMIGSPMQSDPFLDRFVPTLAETTGVAAIVLGGSRARRTASEASDYDLGLYFSRTSPLDTEHLLQVVTTLVDRADAADVTPVGGWGPWIIGGGWLTIGRRKVDLLYRNLDAVADVIGECRAGEIGIHYQPGHPHGFCSVIWMGEIALCQPLHDPKGTIAELKALT
jgi:predicted nucleotidyltransferase